MKMRKGKNKGKAKNRYVQTAKTLTLAALTLGGGVDVLAATADVTFGMSVNGGALTIAPTGKLGNGAVGVYYDTTSNAATEFATNTVWSAILSAKLPAIQKPDVGVLSILVMNQDVTYTSGDTTDVNNFYWRSNVLALGADNTKTVTFGTDANAGYKNAWRVGSVSGVVALSDNHGVKVALGESRALDYATQAALALPALQNLTVAAAKFDKGSALIFDGSAPSTGLVYSTAAANNNGTPVQFNNTGECNIYSALTDVTLTQGANTTALAFINMRARSTSGSWKMGTDVDPATNMPAANIPGVAFDYSGAHNATTRGLVASVNLMVDNTKNEKATVNVSTWGANNAVGLILSHPAKDSLDINLFAKTAAPAVNPMKVGVYANYAGLGMSATIVDANANLAQNYAGYTTINASQIAGDVWSIKEASGTLEIAQTVGIAANALVTGNVFLGGGTAILRLFGDTEGLTNVNANQPGAFAANSLLVINNPTTIDASKSTAHVTLPYINLYNSTRITALGNATNSMTVSYVNDTAALANSGYSGGAGPILQNDLSISAVDAAAFLNEETFKLNRPSFIGDAGVALKGVYLTSGSYVSAGLVDNGGPTNCTISSGMFRYVSGANIPASIGNATWTLAGSSIAGSDLSTAVLVIPNTSALNNGNITVSNGKYATLVVEGTAAANAAFKYTQPINTGTLLVMLRNSSAGNVTNVGDLSLKNDSGVVFVGHANADSTIATSAANVSAGRVRFVGNGNCKVTGSFKANTTKLGSAIDGAATTTPVSLNVTITGAASLGELSFITDPTNLNAQTLNLTTLNAVTDLYSGTSTIKAGSLIVSNSVTLTADKNIAGLAIRTKSGASINGVVRDVVGSPLLIAPQDFDIAKLNNYITQDVSNLTNLTTVFSDLVKLQPAKITGGLTLYDTQSLVVVGGITGPVTSAGNVLTLGDFETVLNLTDGTFLAPLSEVKGDVRLDGGKAVIKKVKGKLEVNGGQSYVAEGVTGVVSIANGGQAFFSSSLTEASLSGADSILGFISTSSDMALTLSKLVLPTATADKSYTGTLVVRGLKLESVGAIGSVDQASKVFGLNLLSLNAGQVQFGQAATIANIQVAGNAKSTIILSGNKQVQAREYANYAFGNVTSDAGYTGPNALTIQVQGAASLVTGIAVAEPVQGANMLPFAIEMANGSLLKVNADLPIGSSVVNMDAKSQAELCLVIDGSVNLTTSIGSATNPLSVISIESGVNPASVRLEKAYAKIIQLSPTATLHFAAGSAFINVVPNAENVGGIVVLDNVTPIVSACNFGAGAGRTLAKIELVGHENVELNGAVIAEQLVYAPVHNASIPTTLTLRTAQLGDCDVISEVDNEFYLNFATSQEMAGDVSIKSGGILVNDGVQLVIKTANLNVPLIGTNEDGVGIVVFDQKNVDFSKSDSQISVGQFGRAGKRLGTLMIKCDDLLVGNGIGDAEINVKNLLLEVPRNVVLSGARVAVEKAEIRGSSFVRIDAAEVSGSFVVAQGARTSIAFGDVREVKPESYLINGTFGAVAAPFERITFASGAKNVISGEFHATELAMSDRNFILSAATTISGLMYATGATAIDLDKNSLTLQNATFKPDDTLTLGITLVNNESSGAIIVASGSTLDLSSLTKLTMNVEVESAAAASDSGTTWSVFVQKEGGKIIFPEAKKVELKVLHDVARLKFDKKGVNGVLVLDKPSSDPLSPITEEEQKLVKDAIDKTLGSSAQVLTDDLFTQIYKEAVANPTGAPGQLVNALHVVMDDKSLTQAQKEETIATMVTQFTYTGAGQASQSNISNLSMVMDNTSFMSNAGTAVAFDSGKIGIAAGDYAAESGGAAWIKPVYGASKQRVYVNDPIGYKSSQAGVLVGFDKNVNDQLLVGIGIGYLGLNTKPNTKVVDGAKTDSDNIIGSLYTRYDLCPEVTLSGLLAYSSAFNKGVSPRTVLTKGGAIAQEYANYKYTSNNVALQLRGQYNFVRDTHEFAPYVSAGVLSLGKIAYLETDTSDNRAVQTCSATMLQGILGMNYTNTVHNSVGSFRPGAYLNFVFFSKNRAKTSMQYDGGSPVIVPAPVNQNVMYCAGLTFDSMMKSGLEVGMNLGGQAAKKYLGVNMQITAKVNF